MKSNANMSHDVGLVIYGTHGFRLASPANSHAYSCSVGKGQRAGPLVPRSYRLS